MASNGRLLTDEQGQLTVRRVLSVDTGKAKVETTFETEGSLREPRLPNIVVSDACSAASETAHEASLASLAMFGEIVPAQSLSAITNAARASAAGAAARTSSSRAERPA
jgi:hypothetical protein